jgi:hypothetical protein
MKVAFMINKNLGRIARLLPAATPASEVSSTARTRIRRLRSCSKGVVVSISIDALEQVGEHAHRDMGVDALVEAMIHRTNVDAVFEGPERLLDPPSVSSVKRRRLRLSVLPLRLLHPP